MRSREDAGLPLLLGGALFVLLVVLWLVLFVSQQPSLAEQECMRWAELNADLSIRWDGNLRCIVKVNGTWVPWVDYRRTLP